MRNQFADWGKETLRQIQTDFWMPSQNLYTESVEQNKRSERGASIWDCGILLTAVAGAIRFDARQYTPLFDRLLQSMNSYRVQFNGTDAYNVYPKMRDPHRLYDDNEWVVLALCQAYETVPNPAYLARAEELYRFVLSGKDSKLGGGIYWEEPQHRSKHTCSNAPASVGAVLLYQLTGKRDYLTTALNLYEWTNANLQDRDALFWDNRQLNGDIDKTKWSYNTALMLRANCLLYTLTQKPGYRNEAERIAHAAETHWVKTDTGAIADEGNFAYSLCEAFLATYAITKDSHWHDITARAMTFVWERCRDSQGHYPKHWDTIPTKPLESFIMRDQASVARGFWILAAEK